MDSRCVATGAKAGGSTGAVELGFWRQIAAAVLGRLPDRLLTAFFRSWQQAEMDSCREQQSAFVATGQFASSPVGETTPPAAALMQTVAAEGPDNSSPRDAGRSPNWAASRLAGGGDRWGGGSRWWVHHCRRPLGWGDSWTMHWLTRLQMERSRSCCVGHTGRRSPGDSLGCCRLPG